jgi:hypothetical protein
MQMTPAALNRELVAEFFKDSGGRVSLNNLTVLQDRESLHYQKVLTYREYYDVDYSRQFGYIFHMSGAGGSGPIEVSGIYFVKGEPKIKEKAPTWVDARDSDPFEDKPRTQAVRTRNRTRRITRLPKAFNLQDGEDILDWLRTNGIESESVWCSTCRDCFPGSDDWNLCKHCWWCDKTGTYSTPDERCDCKSRDDCRQD